MLRNIALLIVLCFAAPAGVLAAPSSRAVEAPGLSSDPAADRFLTLDGAAIRYRDEGPRRAPVIILIHGFTFSLESWDAWAADLARDHRVLRYDLAGHGLSAADPRPGLPNRATPETWRPAHPGAAGRPLSRGTSPRVRRSPA